MFSFRRKPVPIRHPWFGPLALAQPELLKRLELIPSYVALCRRGLSPERTLLFVPEQKESFEAEIFVIGQMFSWDDQSPVLWLFSTVGLCTIEQPTRGNRPAFRRFELVLGTWPNQTPDPDPFPGQRLGVVLSMEGQLPGC